MGDAISEPQFKVHSTLLHPGEAVSESLAEGHARLYKLLPEDLRSRADTLYLERMSAGLSAEQSAGLSKDLSASMPADSEPARDPSGANLGGAVHGAAGAAAVETSGDAAVGGKMGEHVGDHAAAGGRASADKAADRPVCSPGGCGDEGAWSFSFLYETDALESRLPRPAGTY